jgi:hypothetical protein
LKYKRLPIAELSSLEKNFIDFLVLQGISANEWQKLKQTDSTKVNFYIDSFSDMVYEKVLSEAKALINNVGDYIFLFVPYQTHIELSIFKSSKTQSTVIPDDLSTLTFVSSSIKPFEKSRNEDLYQLINQGSRVCRLEDLNQLLNLKSRLN